MSVPLGVVAVSVPMWMGQQVFNNSNVNRVSMNNGTTACWCVCVCACACVCDCTCYDAYAFALLVCVYIWELSWYAPCRLVRARVVLSWANKFRGFSLSTWHTKCMSVRNNSRSSMWVL
jgi:hypothetical protein